MFGLDFETAASWVGAGRLIFFMTFFFAVMLWVFRPSSKKIYEESAQIPFNDDK